MYSALEFGQKTEFRLNLSKLYAPTTYRISVENSCDADYRWKHIRYVSDQNASFPGQYCDENIISSAADEKLIIS